MHREDEDERLRSAALQNAATILLARERAEQELIAAKETLRETAERLRAVFEQAAVGIAIADLDGRFIEANSRFALMLGYATAEIPELTVAQVTHPEDREQTGSNMRDLRSGRVPEYVTEKRYLRKDGGVVWSRTSITLLRDEAGNARRYIGVAEDITARKHAEEALRQSEQFNRAIVESSRDSIKTLSLDGTILWVSGNGARALNLKDSAEVVGKSWVGFWSEADQAAARRAVVTAAEGDTGAFIGNLIVSGRRTWWNVLITPMLDASGKPERLLAVSREITERKEVEEKLREETRVLEILNRTGAALASHLDLEGVVQAVTDAATDITGAEFGAFFYNTTGANGEAFLLYTLSGAPREAFEKFGHPRATPLFGPTFRGEGVIRIHDVLQDERYGQWPPHRGMPPRHPPVRSYLAAPVISRSGDVIGGLFFGHAQPGVFTERSERVLVGVAAQAAVAIDNARLYETTQKASEERKQLLESERSARTEAERASAMKDEFLATLSHELRTPLSAILGWAQVLRFRNRSEADLHQGLTTIERNARMQTQLIEDLLDMSRITSGKLRLDVQLVEPAVFIEAAIETLRPAAEAKGIRLQTVLDPSAGPISGDPSRLQQVVWNLLSNAIKFTPKDGKVQVLLQRVNSHVEISVADTGIGINPEFLPYVFDRFRQADASSTRSFGGLGLGLSIVKKLIELHGGSVHVTSAGEHHGATFTVHLPVTVVRRADEPQARLHPKASAVAALDFTHSNLAGVRVLVVDDAADARELVKRVLVECDAEVITAGTGEEALSLIGTERFHVLVSDIGMPEMDGYQLLAKVRQLPGGYGARLPAVALTAFARSEDRTRALRAGFLVHVSKPIEPAELVATVASVAGRASGQGTAD